MASPAPSWRHPRWQYDEESSAAACRSAARVAARSGQAAVRSSRPAAVEGPRSRPRLVERPAPRARFGACARVAALIVLAGLMVAVPVRLNMAAVAAEVESAELEQREADLMAERSALQARVAALSAPDRVEQLAQQLGMVESVEFEFLDLGVPTVDTHVADGVTVDQLRRR